MKYGWLWLVLCLCLSLGVGLPAAYADHDGTTHNSLLEALTAPNTGGIGDIPSDDDLPDPDLAFIPSIEVKDGNTLLAKWDIQDCCYLYKERFKFESETPGIRIGEAKYPPGKVKEDEFFGVMETYRNKVVIEVPIVREANAPDQLDLKTTFQGCADIGVCYPPQKQVIPVMLGATQSIQNITPPLNPSSNSGGSGLLAGTNNPNQPMISEQDRMANMLTEQRFWALPAFFGFGLLLAFTPCVFPMIPILSSIIAGRGASLTQGHAFTLSLVYVLAMALTYTVVGVIAASLGQNIQIWFQNPWVLITFSGVFVLLALSMFGFYELQVPAALQSRLTDISNKQQGGGYTGVAVMGLLSALIVGPCVAPPLIGVLTVIATTGDKVLGGTALFAMSMGMGVPLLLIGTSAGKWLPKAGAWMDVIKAVFGVLLLAVAIWMLERILPAVITMLLWATLLIVSAIYMGALQSTSGLSGWRTFSKGLGTVMLVYGVLLLVGVAAGGRDTLQPLRGVLIAGNSATSQQKLPFRMIKTVNDLDTVIQQAGNRPVMLDFYADWCISCKEMDKFTFSDAQVQATLANAILLKADVTANDDADQALLKRFNLIGPPAILFFGNNGAEKQNYRVVGFMPADSFNTHAQQALYNGANPTLAKSF